MNRRDPMPLGEGISAFLARFGLPTPEVVDTIEERWASLGSPWADHARPLVLKDGELVVEARDPATVTMLRYAVGDLHRVLDRELGTGVVRSVTIRPPARGRAGKDPS
ncbi:MAG: DciA family protein [Acidimicrobiia bacterium]|jgi:predicted nucleic acid-binding Zn ribbon protein